MRRPAVESELLLGSPFQKCTPGRARAGKREIVLLGRYFDTVALDKVAAASNSYLFDVIRSRLGDSFAREVQDQRSLARRIGNSVVRAQLRTSQTAISSTARFLRIDANSDL